MAFTPISTKAELDGLDPDEIFAGYMSAKLGDPEPGENRGKAFWHGWRNRMIDFGQIEPDVACRQLATEIVNARRTR